jgi:hypothetical protein
MFRGCSITKVYKLKELCYPQTPRLELLTNDTSYTKIKPYTKDTTKYTIDTRNVSVHNLPSMPQ